MNTQKNKKHRSRVASILSIVLVGCIALTTALFSDTVKTFISVVANYPSIEVTYDANGGSFDDGATINVVEYEDGSIIDGEYKEPEHDSYYMFFDGWYTDKECTKGNEFDPDSDTLLRKENITVYAKWKDLRVNVTYDANGGHFENSTTNVVEYVEGNATSGTYEVPEHNTTYIAFAGWYEDAACTQGKEFNPETDPTELTEDITVYAKWEQVYPVLQAWTSSSTSDFHNSAYKSKITTAEIVDYMEAPESPAAGPWDVSEKKNGSVMAWLTTEDDGATYHLTISGNGYGKVFANTDSSYAFYNLSGLTKIEGTNDVLDLGGLIGDGDKNDINTWTVKPVTTLNNMFYGCKALTSIDVKKWNTSTVTDMQGVFSFCSSLTQIDVNTNEVALSDGTTYTAWDTSNVENMQGMFSNCKSLTQVKFEDWDTGAVENMSVMFQYCENLTNNLFTDIDLSDWDTSSVTNMKSMFQGCRALINLDVSKWDTSKVTNMYCMFSNCQNLSSLNIDKKECVSNDGTKYMAWNTGSVQKFDYMFFSCEKLLTVGDNNLKDWDTSSAINMSFMFQHCYALINLDVSSWNVGSVTNMSDMFNGCTQLTSLGENNVKNWITNSVINTKNMFYDCKVLTNLDVANWNVKNVTNMANMFRSCFKLEVIDISNWDMSGITGSSGTSRMLYDCISLKEIIIPSSLKYIGTGFAARCQSLVDITFSHSATDNIELPSEGGTDNSPTGAFYAKSPYTADNLLMTNLVTENDTVKEYLWNTDHRGFPVNVIYNANGGKIGEADSNTVKYNPQTKAVMNGTYNQPTLGGKSFVGWYTDEDCTAGNEFDISTHEFDLSVNGYELNVYAKWEKLNAYVDGSNRTGNASDDNNGLTAEEPLASLKQAYKNLSAGGTIYIVGEVSISDEVTLNKSYYKDSDGQIDISTGNEVMIKRYSQPGTDTNADGVVDANIPTGFNVTSFNGSLLYVANTGTLNLKDIKINGHKNAVTTGKDTEIALGVKAIEALIENRGCLNISNAELFDNNNSYTGGAIYNISNKASSLNITGGKIHDNAAKSGGGICNIGPDMIISGGEIYNNTAEFGGGVYVQNKDAVISGGKIHDNTADYGGGVYHMGTDQKFNSDYRMDITGGEIYKNIATESGGGIDVEYGSLYISGGKVYNNQASSGAGILNWSVLNISDGEIYGNIATENGGGIENNADLTVSGAKIYANTASKGNGIYQNSSLELSEGALINVNNDVYLPDQSKVIKVTGELTNDTVAIITPNSYDLGRTVVEVSYNDADSNPEVASAVYEKFNLTPSESYALRPGDYLDNTVASNEGINDTDVIISKAFTVTYDANTTDTVENMPDPITHKAYWNEVQTGISSVVPTRSGYDFESWNTAADGSGDTYVPGSPVNKDITVYAQWAIPTIEVTYDANGQVFDDGTETNVVKYKQELNSNPVISKTSNVSDDGSSYGSGYAANLATTDTVTIPGAVALEVTVTYQTQSISYDWLAIYDGSVTPSTSNYASSITGGKIGGTTKKTATYIVPGDTVQFFFKSNASSNAYYGYYAEVKPFITVVSGEYEEPSHSVSTYGFDGWYTDKECTDGNEFDINSLTKDITVYAKWRDLSFTVTYDANGQVFDGGAATNVMKYKQELNSNPVISKTANVSDDGSSYGSGYAANLATTDVVTIPGAGVLEVTVTYQTHNTTYDWLAIYDGSITPSDQNFDKSITGGKLGATTKKTVTYIVQGDTVQFFFKSNSSSNSYYGYYAEVKPFLSTISGKYAEPTHNTSYYGFAGWYTDAECTEGKEFDITKVTEDITVYAKWEPIYPILKGWTSRSTTDFHNSSYKTKITTAEIVNYEKLPETVAAGPWDVSEKENGSVMAWLTTEDNGTTYHLTISGNGYGKVFANTSSNGTFSGFNKMKTLTGTDIWEFGGLKNSDGSWEVNPVRSLGEVGYLTNMPVGMFSGCSNLTEIDVSKWDVSYVTNMSGVFLDCKSLTDIDVSKWDVGSVTTMSGMFDSCSSLSTLDVSKWDTSSVQSMNRMFYGCTSLSNLGEGNVGTKVVTLEDGTTYTAWDVSSVKNFGYSPSQSDSSRSNGVFSRCSSLTTLDVSKWDTSSAINIESLFWGCTSLSDLGEGNIGTKQVTLEDGTTYTAWDVSNVTDMYGVFAHCGSLPSLDVSKWDTSLVTDMGSTFMGCSKLTELDVSKWDTSSVTSVRGMESMFLNCSSLISLDVSKWDTSFVTTMRNMFSDCISLNNLGVGNVGTKIVTLEDGTTYTAWDASKVTDMDNMFARCRSLETLDVSKWNTSSVTTMGSMFESCDKLKQLGEGNIGTKKITLADGTTYTAWDVSRVNNMRQLFYDCRELDALDVSKWNVSSVTNMNSMFDLCKLVTELDVSKWNVSSVKYMSSMFSDCNALETLDVSNWDTHLVQDMAYMFNNCGSLTVIDIADWDCSNITQLSKTKSMFNNCTKLTQLTIPYSLKYFGNGFAGYCNSLADITLLHLENDTLSFAVSGYAPNGVLGPFYLEEGNEINTNVKAINISAINYEWEKDNRTVSLNAVNTITIIYDANTGNYGSDAETGEDITTNSVVYEEQSDFVMSGKYIEPSYEGGSKTFAGWYTEPTCSDGNEFDINATTDDTTVYAKWDDIEFTVTYNANEGLFGSESTNPVSYLIGIGTVTKTSKTDNVSEDGSEYGSGYDANLETIDVITIPGAESLEVSATYQTHNTSYDWLAIYDGSVTPTSSNYSSSIAKKKLGGTTKTTATYTVPGDTAQFYFKSNGSSNGYYGYYATITGFGRVANPTTDTYAVPTRDGYEFAGWYTDAACTDGNEFDVNGSLSDVTVYAKWVEASATTLDLLPRDEMDNMTYWQSVVNQMMDGTTEITLDGTITEMPMDVIDAVSYLDTPVTFIWNEQTFVIGLDTINDFEYVPGQLVSIAELATTYAVIEEPVEDEIIDTESEESEIDDETIEDKEDEVSDETQSDTETEGEDVNTEENGEEPVDPEPSQPTEETNTENSESENDVTDNKRTSDIEGNPEDKESEQPAVSPDESQDAGTEGEDTNVSEPVETEPATETDGNTQPVEESTINNENSSDASEQGALAEDSNFSEDVPVDLSLEKPNTDENRDYWQSIVNRVAEGTTEIILDNAVTEMPLEVIDALNQLETSVKFAWNEQVFVLNQETINDFADFTNENVLISDLTTKYVFVEEGAEIEETEIPSKQDNVETTENTESEEPTVSPDENQAAGTEGENTNVSEPVENELATETVENTETVNEAA